MTHDTPMVEGALDCAARGWHVFPCWPKSKKPLTPNGCNDATNDEELIRSWWYLRPWANPAVAAGPSGLVVVDVDPDHGGNESLNRLILDIGPEVYETLRAVTPTGGRHLYFLRPPGLDIRNSVGRLAPGLDIRGIGGYVMLPPSVHPHGGRYRWEPDTLGDPAPLPDALARLILDTTRDRRADIRDGRPLVEGERNDRIFLLGCWLRGVGFTMDEIAAALACINDSRCMPPLKSDEVAEIIKSVSGYERGGSRRQPRPQIHTRVVVPHV